MNSLVMLLSTFATALCSVGMLLPILRRRVVDVPNHRSSHVVPTPRGGGLGLLLGTLVGIWVAGAQAHHVSLSVVVVLLGMASLGFVDDLWSLSARVRLAWQLFLSLIVSMDVLGVTTPDSLGLSLFAAVFVVGYTNSFNFMDGINGVSALVGSVSGCWYIWLGHALDAYSLWALGIILTGTSLAFIPWNAVSPRVFLGDVGSYLLGALSAICALMAWSSGAPWQSALAPLLIYVADTVVTAGRRAVLGHSLAVAHRDHIYQRLTCAGLSHLQVAFHVTAFVVVCSLVSASLDGRLWIENLVLGAVVVGYVLSPRWAVLMKRRAGWHA